ncbi:hypothetical protein [Sphingomonas sp.]|uniref:hypothetical protein n=1 Tax=Sphingomonas sp. TaxID=28214 RepID=UPI001EB33696|nr:hypothetical protein [Sphingomonas sp.]MBX3592981.1 hypothetical protein [Sphingomonas sp.]
MVAFAVLQRLTPNRALALAGAGGALIALATLAVPGAMLEDLTVSSGIAAIIPAAEPPLGTTARIIVGVFAGGIAAMAVWLTLSGLIAWRDSRALPAGTRRPTIRRADAHPDAPPREPLRANRDIIMPGAPVPEHAGDALDLALPEPAPDPVLAMGPAEPAQIVVPMPSPRPQPAPRPTGPPPVQPLPANLDQPLSAFDPGALLEEPLTPPPPVVSLRRKPVEPPLYADTERFETFELTPPVRPQSVPDIGAGPAPIATPQTDASVHALLDRLERGIARRGDSAEATPDPGSPDHRLEDTLESLRRLAMRA